MNFFRLVNHFSKQLISMIRTIAIVLFALLSLEAGFAQAPSFIYRENGKFYNGCEEFYPMIMNYSLQFEDSAGHYRITPPMNRCREEQGCSSCGTSAKDYRDYIITNLRTIQAMGFNTIRVVGMAIHHDDDKDEEGNYTGSLVSNVYFRFGMSGPDKPHCHKQTTTGLPLTGPEDFKRQGDLFAQLFDIIRQEGIPLKVMLVTGGHGVEMKAGLYADYLRYLAGRFSDEPVLFAYDFYNEPQYSEKIRANDFDKVDRAWWFHSWYKAVKDEAPWHFVTYGPALADIYSWDPEIMPSDFFAFHVYNNPREHLDWKYDSTLALYRSQLLYLSRNFSRPWMLGETGIAAVDRSLYPSYTIHPIVQSEEVQHMFIRNTLRYARYFGSGGYAVWVFKDGLWSYKKLNTVTAKEFFMGMVNFRENNTWKPAAYEFAGFQPGEPCPDCSDPEPDQYYNYDRYPFRHSKGIVFARETPGGPVLPFRDACVNALLGMPGKHDMNHTFNTFTDAEGKFTLHSLYDDPRIVVKLVRISAPGMDLIYRENWGEGLDMKQPFYLESLDPGQLPPVPVQAEALVLKGRQVARWERKRVLTERKLVIRKRATLVLTDTLYMMPGAKIVVEAGGTLEVQNGAITGLCDWQGIDVHKAGKGRREGQLILHDPAAISGTTDGIRYITP